MSLITRPITSIPSCGLSLLQSPYKDFILTISDDNVSVVINCHRAVILAHAERLGTYSRGEDFFSSSVQVENGYVPVMIELVQYMYLKDPTLISQKDKMLTMCSRIGMKLDFFFINNNQLKKVNKYDHLLCMFQSSESCCIVEDFLKRLVVPKSSPIVFQETKTNERQPNEKQVDEQPNEQQSDEQADEQVDEKQVDEQSYVKPETDTESSDQYSRYPKRRRKKIKYFY